ncbi:hypothetical protein [Amycolatopsis sp. NPDC052450]|uniref:hypothetical protein n=1 Tax=Amycolatopsis sp. NPDC052450 TaxID=3363937 RepID=UPI0037CCBC43
MAARSFSSPPRPIVVGDVVAAYSDALGTWTAGQITGIDLDWKKVDVLDLDWSGPEPTSLLDLGDLRPLRLTHHSWEGKLSHCHFNWVLPRSHKVIGNQPLLRTQGSNSYSSAWRLGLQLALQRSWDDGNHDSWEDPGARTFSDKDFLHEVGGRPCLDGEVYDVTITVADTFDCSRLVAAGVRPLRGNDRVHHLPPVVASSPSAGRLGEDNKIRALMATATVPYYPQRTEYWTRMWARRAGSGRPHRVQRHRRDHPGHCSANRRPIAMAFSLAASLLPSAQLIQPDCI